MDFGLLLYGLLVIDYMIIVGLFLLWWISFFMIILWCVKDFLFKLFLKWKKGNRKSIRFKGNCMVWRKYFFVIESYINMVMEDF